MLERGLTQSKTSFCSGVVFAGLGVGLIVFAAAAAVLWRDDDGVSAISVVALVAGTIVAVVAALFVMQSHRMTVELIDCQREDRNRREALEIAETIPDERTCSRLLAMLTMNLAGAFVSDKVMQALLDASSPTRSTRAVAPDGDGAATP